MKIINIRLTNFQGIQDMEVNLDGHSAAIYGDNGTGKTTIYNAITWLLFDKPSTGAKNWSPKTRGSDGEQHNLEHSVAAVFSTLDGQRLALGKTLREVWKKKRGAAAAEYTGNTIDYYVDGVPVKEKEYTATVSRHCGGDEMMKMLTMPDYFPEVMEWKKRRELLLEICGDVTDETVIESTPDLIDLPTYLLKPGTLGQYYTVEEYGKIAKARKADINRQLDTLPGRIDEAQRAIPADLPDRITLDAWLHTAAQETEKIRRDAADIRAAGESSARAALAVAQAELSEARANYTKRTQNATAGTYEAQAVLVREVREAERRADDLRADASVTRRKVERMTALRESILAEYREEAAVKFDADRETCPTCGRRLPEDQIETMRENFNQQRAQRLAEINSRGKREASKDMIAELEAKAAEYDRRAEEAIRDADAARDKRDELEKNLATIPAFETTAEYEEITRRIEELRRVAEDADRCMESRIAAVDVKLQESLAMENEIRGQMIKAEAAARQRARVAELLDREKALAEEYEAVERGVYLCELFTKAKVGLLTERINSKFRSVSFQLFVEQVNGGLAECCEVLIPCDGAMVPYATANHAARVNSGLEIVATIAEHFGQEMPVIVDNAESVTKLIDTDGQVIRLVVSEEDKTLRVEVAA